MIPRLALYTTSMALVLLVVGVAGFVLFDQRPTTHGWRGQSLTLPPNQTPRWRGIWEQLVRYWRRL
jgi:hypothetical protein